MSYSRTSQTTHISESCPTYIWVLSHICKSHVTHMNESCHKHIWVCLVTSMCQSCHNYEWVMSHPNTSHTAAVSFEIKERVSKSSWFRRLIEFVTFTWLIDFWKFRSRIEFATHVRVSLCVYDECVRVPLCVCWMYAWEFERACKCEFMRECGVHVSSRECVCVWVRKRVLCACEFAREWTPTTSAASSEIKERVGKEFVKFRWLIKIVAFGWLIDSMIFWSLIQFVRFRLLIDMVTLWWLVEFARHTHVHHGCFVFLK